MNTNTREAPADIIARVEAASERLLTPCGDGHMVWRRWGGTSDKPYLALFHGNFGSWKHWIHNVTVLSEHFRVLAADIPGFGESAEPPKPYTAHSLATIVAHGLVEIAGATAPLNVAGFSFGSGTTSEVAHLLGSRVRKAVLVSAGRNMDGVTRAPMDPFVKWRDMATREERLAAHRRNLEVIMISNPQRIDDLAVLIQSTNAEQARLRSVFIAKDATHRFVTPQLKCDLATIWAEHDSTIGPYMHERPIWLKKYHPNARYGIITDAGHWCSYEQPEQFNRLLPELLYPEGLPASSA